MEMCINPSHASTFEGLEEEEGKWIEIENVQVTVRVSGFKCSPSSFILNAFKDSQIKRLDPINNRHFMEFVNFEYIRDYNTDRDVAIDTMGVIFRTSPIHVNGEDMALTKKVFYLRDAREKKIYCVAYGTLAYEFEKRFPECMGDYVILVLKMWRIKRYGSDDDDIWLESLEGCSDLMFNPDIDEVEDLRDELDPDEEYVAKHRPIRR